MVEQSPQPLSLDQAKQQLRGAATELGLEEQLAEQIRQHPFLALSLAFASGALLSDERINGTLIRRSLEFLAATQAFSGEI